MKKRAKKKTAKKRPASINTAKPKKKKPAKRKRKANCAKGWKCSESRVYTKRMVKEGKR